MTTQSSTIDRMDVLRIAISATALIAVFVVATMVERKAEYRDISQRTLIQAKMNQVYKVLQLAISRTDSYAVETDPSGVVIWMNHQAEQDLNLTIGENSTSCMRSDHRTAHTEAFSKAMKAKESDYMHQPIVAVECVALRKDQSEIAVSIETWKTPNGAMAFLTPIGKNKVAYPRH